MLELFLYKVSGTLTGTAEVNTGLKFVTKETVEPYLTTKSRYEGTATAAGVTRSLTPWPCETASSRPRRSERPGAARRAAPGWPALGSAAWSRCARAASSSSRSWSRSTSPSTTDALPHRAENFETLLPYFAPFAILAAGEVFVMILGEIDLSIGAVYLFAPIMFYKLNTRWACRWCRRSCSALRRCAWWSALINGVFVAVVGINSFVTTLGMLFAFEG